MIGKHFAAGKTIILLGVMMAALFFSCATDDDMADSAPSWAEDDTRADDDSYLFTAVGRGEDREEALLDLAENLTGKILKQMGFSEEDFALFPGEREYLTELFAAFLEGDDTLIPGGRVEDMSWFREDGNIAVAVRFRYGRDEFDLARDALRGYLAGGSEYERLMSRSEELEGAGYDFSAFLYDMKAASSGRTAGGLLGGYLLGKAFERGAFHLDRTEVPALSGADRIYLGARRSWPYKIAIPLSPEESDRIPWSVSMAIPGRSGTEDILSLSLPSEKDGSATLSYPFPSGIGTGKVSFSLIPGEYDPLLENVSSLEELEARLLRKAMTRFSLEKTLPVVRDRRVLKTALIIEDRDVAGRTLATRTTEESVYSSLREEGYAVERESFDLEKLRSMSELEMIREFNSHYANNYDIILFSEAGIRNFSQKGDLYQMNAGAVLYEADLWEQRINVVEDISVSVSGGDPARLVTSAFYQLGKDITEACLKLKDN